MAGATNRALKSAGLKEAAIRRIRTEARDPAVTVRSAIQAANPGDIRARKVLQRLPTKSGSYAIALSALKDVAYTNHVVGRVEGVNAALDAGKKLPPIRLVIDKDGKVDISDGNHRLRVYRARGIHVLNAHIEVVRGKGSWAANEEKRR